MLLLKLLIRIANVASGNFLDVTETILVDKEKKTWLKETSFSNLAATVYFSVWLGKVDTSVVTTWTGSDVTCCSTCIFGLLALINSHIFYFIALFLLASLEERMNRSICKDMECESLVVLLVFGRGINNRYLRCLIDLSLANASGSGEPLGD